MPPDSKPRVGIPYRTFAEEALNKRDKYDFYVQSIERAGGRAVPVSLKLPPAELDAFARSLDAVILPGSPADVDPARYGDPRHPAAADPDPDRERTDYALLENAFADRKPILAICYGIQILNVFLGGTLVPDIANEIGYAIEHGRGGLPPSEDRFHAAAIAPDTALARLAADSHGAAPHEERINTAHHQAIRDLGRGLRATAHAPDGVIEAVEWTGDSNSVAGVQWHPERMPGHALSEALFRQLVQAASGVRTGAR